VVEFFKDFSQVTDEDVIAILSGEVVEKAGKNNMA